jgi:hypothetical protein
MNFKHEAGCMLMLSQNITVFRKATHYLRWTERHFGRTWSLQLPKCLYVSAKPYGIIKCHFTIMFTFADARTASLRYLFCFSVDAWWSSARIPEHQQHRAASRRGVSSQRLCTSTSAANRQQHNNCSPGPSRMWGCRLHYRGGHGGGA